MVALLFGCALCGYAWVYLPRQMQQWQRKSLQAFARAIELRTQGRFGHSEPMAQFAQLVARQLGLSAWRRHQLELAIYLRDIGMVAIPYAILNKREPLTAVEEVTLARHAEIGAAIVEQIPLLHTLAPLVRLHHVRYCEQPDAPLEAHLLAALSTLFEVSKQEGLDAALERLKQQVGRGYHPKVIAAIEACLSPTRTSALEEMQRSAALW
ncbi:MAG: HD domain-containing phosphohydrolase [candidate division WOR-3 bacterium]